MPQLYFEKKYHVRYYETAAHQKLRITSLLNYFEEVALLQSIERNVGLDYYQQHQVIWMLHKWDVILHQIPVFNQQILIRTLPVSISGFTGFRKFWVLDSAGQIMVEADSAWLFINTLNKRPVRISDDIKKAYGHFEQPESKLEMPNVPGLLQPDFSKEFSVRSSDIDINEHVNNVRYLEWALEAIPKEIICKHRLLNLKIVFKKETVYGQKINSQVQIIQELNALKCMHQIVDEQCRIVCELYTEWEPI